MTYRPACEAAKAAAAARTQYNLTAHPAWRLEDPDRGIKCGACNDHHATIRLVQECYADLFDYERERDAEAYAEGAYSRYLERHSYGYND
jgi:hypothetical protein